MTPGAATNRARKERPGPSGAASKPETQYCNLMWDGAGTPRRIWNAA